MYYEIDKDKSADKTVDDKTKTTVYSSKQKEATKKTESSVPETKKAKKKVRRRRDKVVMQLEKELSAYPGLLRRWKKLNIKKKDELLDSEKVGEQFNLEEQGFLRSLVDLPVTGEFQEAIEAPTKVPKVQEDITVNRSPKPKGRTRTPKKLVF